MTEEQRYRLAELTFFSGFTDAGPRMDEELQGLQMAMEMGLDTREAEAGLAAELSELAGFQI